MINKKIENLMLSEKNPLNNYKLNNRMDSFIEKNISKAMFIQLMQFIVVILACTGLGMFFYNTFVKFNFIGIVLSILSGILSFVSFKGLLGIINDK